MSSLNIKVKCLRCGKEWKKKTEKEWNSDSISSSICYICLTQIIYEKYRKRWGEKNCFGILSTCKKAECSYYKWCQFINKIKEREE